MGGGGKTFVEGKFDAFNRGIPYDSLVQAFRNLHSLRHPSGRSRCSRSI